MNSIVMLNGLMGSGAAGAATTVTAGSLTLTWYGDQDAGTDYTVTASDGNNRVPVKQRARVYQMKLSGRRLDDTIKVSSIGVSQVRRSQHNV